MKTIGLLLGACAFASCTVGDSPQTAVCGEDSWQGAKSDFSRAFSELHENFEGTAPIVERAAECGGQNNGIAFDLFGFVLPDPCDLLAPMLAFGDDAIHAGYILGVEGTGILGTGLAYGGYDLVWDIYNQQMTVSHYSGGGLGVPAVGAAMSFYTGLAFGFDHGVSDWDGFFVTTELEIGLPLVKNFIGFTPAVFVTGNDSNDNGFISPNEMLMPPNGVYGFTLGLNVGINLLPEIAPISGAIKMGRWSAHKEAIREFYERFQASELDVTLVDHHTGATCPIGWPYVANTLDCVIQFGGADETYLERSVDVAFSICEVAGLCTLPLSFQMSATSLAIGALRDNDVDFGTFCPNHELTETSQH